MTDKKILIYPLWVIYALSFFAYLFCPQSKFKVISFIGLIIAFLGLIITSMYFNNKKRKANSETSKSEKNETDRNLKDWKLVLLVFDSVFFLILALTYSGLIIPPDEPHGPDYAKIEWFLAVVSVIGIVGAIWAILARIDAQRSFLQAVEAHKEAKGAADNAMNAYRAVAGIVSFEDMLIPDGEKQGVPMLKGLLEVAREELILILGIPAVGYFRKVTTTDSSGNVTTGYPLRQKAVDFCYQLAAYIRNIPYNPEVKLVRIFYFDDATLESFSDGAIKKEEMTAIDKQLLKDAYDALNNAVEHIGSSTIFVCKRYSVELGIRFAIARSAQKNRMTEDKALVWVVSDFEHDDPGAFEAAGFTTLDKNIIGNLRRLSEDYIKILPNITKTSPPSITKTP